MSDAYKYTGCWLGEDYMTHPWCSCCVRNVERCKGMKDASEAPLCLLPQYMASKFIVVRRVARARFVELQGKRPTGIETRVPGMCLGWWRSEGDKI